MSTKKDSALAVFGLFSILIPAVSMAQVAGTFPSFIPFAGSPEGLAIDKTGNVYIAVDVGNPADPNAGSDQIWKFTRSGEKSIVADFGPPHGGRCGLALDVEGNLYMARNTPAPAPSYTGVYRVNPAGDISKVPGTNQMNFPDALTFDQRGNLYITETFSPGPDGPSFGLGGIWRVPKGGTAELWLSHELLTGIVPTLFPFRVGANGIAFYHGDLYVINTDKCLIVRVGILPDGSPAEPQEWAKVNEVPESFLAGSPFPLMLEGIALDVQGNAYVTVISRNAVVCINADDRSQKTIAVNNPWPVHPLKALLDAPVNPVFGTGDGERQNLFLTNMGLYGFMVPIPDWTWPGPSLVKIAVDTPGVPVP